MPTSPIVVETNTRGPSGRSQALTFASMVSRSRSPYAAVAKPHSAMFSYVLNTRAWSLVSAWMCTLLNSKLLHVPSAPGSELSRSRISSAAYMMVFNAVCSTR